MEIVEVFPIILRIKFQFLTVAYMAPYVWVRTYWFNLFIFRFLDLGNEVFWDISDIHIECSPSTLRLSHSPLNFVPHIL